jgi:hypothetical protein
MDRAETADRDFQRSGISAEFFVILSLRGIHQVRLCCGFSFERANTGITIDFGENTTVLLAPSHRPFHLAAVAVAPRLDQS